MSTRKSVFLKNSESTLGLDIGIASCGWALLTTDRIVGAGAYIFSAPETVKGVGLNQERRAFRLARRNTRRRAVRNRDIESLCQEFGLTGKDGFPKITPSPWELRAEGLDRPLSNLELAVVLRHAAKHRGFKSNSKRDTAVNDVDDNKLMLTAISANRQLMTSGGWRTIGEMFAKSAEFAVRKRNRGKDYSRSISRDDLGHEIRKIFYEQRRLGNAAACPELEQEFFSIAFFQRPIASSEGMVGCCELLPGEKRAPLHARSFELFRFLSRLNNITLKSRGVRRRLTPEELSLAVRDFGSQNGITYKRLRKVIGIDDGLFFEGVNPDDEGKRDIVKRSGGCMEGTSTLRKALHQQWDKLLHTPRLLDDITAILAFRDDYDQIEEGLRGFKLDQDAAAALMGAVRRGEFSGFKGAGNLSSAACRELIPHLLQGKMYSEACEALGVSHTRSVARFDITDKRQFSGITKGVAERILNPVARAAIIESLKQVRAVVLKYGLPEKINIELARDVGKSRAEREKIEKGIEKRTGAKEALRKEMLSVIGCIRQSNDDLLRYELWKEQGGVCLYTGTAISPHDILSTATQIDHILPKSRSQDDSYHNKTLCKSTANQQKGNQTPFEWFGGDADRWGEFSKRINALKVKGLKKRNFLLDDSSFLQRFSNRNLNDTRYACRVLLEVLEGLYPDDGLRHVCARPGQLTSVLRKAWGLERFKKDADGNRLPDDRHHALDAMVLAATNEAELQRRTRRYQRSGRDIDELNLSDIPPPWSDFTKDVQEAFENVFVVRQEKRRARGEGHSANAQAIREVNGVDRVIVRKGVDFLELKDIPRIKDIDRHPKIREALTNWINAKKPKGAPPLSPKGDPIRKVKMVTNDKVGLLINHGSAPDHRDSAVGRGEMVRVDVFRGVNPKNKKSEFLLVPIYIHQVAGKKKWPLPPNQAIKQGVEAEQWPIVGADAEFMFSLCKNSFVEVVGRDGVVRSGYFRGANVSDGGITLSDHRSMEIAKYKCGTLTALSIKRFSVDRTGVMSEIKKEARTWHGAVCM